MNGGGSITTWEKQDVFEREKGTGVSKHRNPCSSLHREKSVGALLLNQDCSGGEDPRGREAEWNHGLAVLTKEINRGGRSSQS